MAQNDTVAVRRGTTFAVEYSWIDEAGAPLDITNATLSVLDCYPANLKPFYQIEMTSAPAGRFRLSLPAAHVASPALSAPPEQLNPGPRNNVRVAVDYGAGAIQTSPVLEINVI